jgi:hypothetical protein
VDDDKISWHPAFVEGLKENYKAYGAGLEYKDEFQLSKEPLKIDVIVVKKRPDIVVDTDTGRIFRGHNIFEYKSPTDYVSVEDFQKSCAYVWLYAIESKADMTDITLSFVMTSHPRALLDYCVKRLGYAKEEKYQEVYYVTGSFVPMQIIVSPKLGGDERLWLGSLRNNLKASEMEELLQAAAARETAKHHKAYLRVILAANPNTLREVRALVMTQGLREALIDMGLTDEWEERGVERGAERAKIEDALAMINDGDSIERASRITGVSVERLEELLYGTTGAD